MFAPAATPQPVLARLEVELRRATARPDVKKDDRPIGISYGRTLYRTQVKGEAPVAAA